MKIRDDNVITLWSSFSASHDCNHMIGAPRTVSYDFTYGVEILNADGITEVHVGHIVRRCFLYKPGSIPNIASNASNT